MRREMLIFADMDTTYNPMQRVKRQFFAMRNGVIADVLRRGGSPFRIIFGLNLPQIVDIARAVGCDPDLGRQLWHNDTTRESMLLAPMLMDAATFGRDEAEAWIAAVPAPEIADVLCHRLLRHVDYALPLAMDLSGAEVPMSRYTALRLMFNLVASQPRQALELAEAVARRPQPLTDRLAAMLADEARFQMES